jgi:hypothetical protein
VVDLLEEEVSVAQKLPMDLVQGHGLQEVVVEVE